MTRYWMTPLVTLALLAGGAAAASPAFASPATTHHATAATSPLPGDPMVWAHGGHADIANAAESTNWSGYANHSGKYRSVSASWTEPKVTCNGTKYAAFWVGLDGYSSDSVEQTGTDSDCVGSTPSYYGWYEMYPAAPVNFSNVVKAGNKMHAEVLFSGADTYTLILKNITRGWTKKITKTESGLARSSAEVITEAPASGTTGAILPLADFHTVKFTVAKDNGSSMGTKSPTKIIMVTSSGTNKDTTSAITSAGAFSNTWVRAG